MADTTYHELALNKLNDKSLFIQDAFIEGKWVSKEKKFDVYEPSTGTVLGQVADCSADDFEKAIQSAHTAQIKFWESTTALNRGSLLRRWHDLILANQEDLAIILSLENGKTHAEAKNEVLYAASFISWFAEEAPRSYGTTIPSSTTHTSITTVKEPVGVCGIITPWNFPAAMITRKVAPALAAGCAVVIKPPSETPYSCLAFTRLAIIAGIPGEVVQVVTTADHRLGSILATHDLVRKVSFTGSTGVGKLLAGLAAGTLKRVSLELGGNAPFIVFGDADLEAAVEGAMACKFRCSGQTCVCANRFYVQKDIVGLFTVKLVDRVAALKMGGGLEASTTQGPLVHASAVTKVQQHIADAVSKGAKVETGGHTQEPGYFHQPTVLSGVTQKMLVTKEETFGPLAAIVEFSTEDEVIRLANETDVGLAGYFFSRDVGRVMRVARKLQVGMVGVNTGKISAVESPFGGVKESGYGREGSLLGLAEYQNVKSITVGGIDR